MAHDIWNLWPHDGYAFVDCKSQVGFDYLFFAGPFNLLNVLQNNKVWKKILTFVLLQGNPVVASPKEQLYEQMTSNPAFTERNIQKTNAYHLDSRPEQNFLVMHHTLLSLYVCVWLVNNLSSTAPIESPIIYIWSPADICEQLMGNEFIFWFSRC